MFIKYLIGLVAFSLILVSMGPLYATSPQKSTIITINGDSINAPRVCDADITCELRNTGISFIKRVDSLRVTVFKGEDTSVACEAGFKAGVNLIILSMGDDFRCSTLRD